MSDTSLGLNFEITQYLHQKSLREHDALTALRLQTQKMSESQMQISPEQGQFMQLLVEILGARHYLELGVYTGYSTLAVALALPQDGKVVACDVNVEWTKIAKRFWEKAGVAEKIDLRLAPALETLSQLSAQNYQSFFDFVFIDADKVNYQAYYDHVLPLVRRGGVIAIDNVLQEGKVAKLDNCEKNTISIRHLNNFIFQDQRVSISMLPIGDGLTLARKR